MSEIYKGIFWIKDLVDYSNSVVVHVLVDKNGQVIGDNHEELTSKKGDNFSHKKSWEQMSKQSTNNKPFDYYPRGRVEIKNGKAIIYANPYICGDMLVDWCIETFHLSEENGFEAVACKPDHSEHYKCYLDKE